MKTLQEKNPAAQPTSRRTEHSEYSNKQKESKHRHILQQLFWICLELRAIFREIRVCFWISRPFLTNSKFSILTLFCSFSKNDQIPLLPNIVKVTVSKRRQHDSDHWQNEPTFNLCFHSTSLFVSHLILFYSKRGFHSYFSLRIRVFQKVKRKMASLRDRQIGKKWIQFECKVYTNLLWRVNFFMFAMNLRFIQSSIQLFEFIEIN